MGVTEIKAGDLDPYEQERRLRLLTKARTGCSCFLRRFGKLFVTTSLVGEKSTLRGWSHHFGFAAMCFSYLDAKVSQRFLRFAKSTWSAPAFQKWIPTPLNCYVAKTILCLDPLLGSAWISGPWLARPETTLLRSFNTLCPRVIRSDDFHNMRKISLSDWICKKCKKWKTFQNMSYLKISKNNLEKSQKNRTSGGSKWEVKETTIWDTKKSQNIWTNITIISQKKQTCQKVQEHAKPCVDMQAQQWSAWLWLWGLQQSHLPSAPHLCASSMVQHVCGEPNKMFIIKNMIQNDSKREKWNTWNMWKNK